MFDVVDTIETFREIFPTLQLRNALVNVAGKVFTVVECQIDMDGDLIFMVQSEKN